MKILNIIKRLVIAFTIFMLIIFFTTFPFYYSRTHPDFNIYQKKISLLKHFGATIDLSHLNSGDWDVACLFGGYSNPSIIMQEYGYITPIDAIYLWMKGFPFLRRGQVAEGEALISYVDQTGTVKFIHFDGRTGGESLEDVHVCTSRSEPIVSVW